MRRAFKLVHSLNLWFTCRQHGLAFCAELTEVFDENRALKRQYGAVVLSLFAIICKSPPNRRWLERCAFFFLSFCSPRDISAHFSRE